MVIMVTGGAGYVGSHTCIELIRAGYSVLIFDDFSNSSPEVVNRIERIAGMAPSVVRGDVRDLDQLTATLKSFRCEAVLHFAGLKSISASFEEPARYYDYNVVGSLTLVKAMQMAGVRRLIFSSSATVYGEPLFLPLTETHPLVPSSVYGRTKMIADTVDLCGVGRRCGVDSHLHGNVHVCRGLSQQGTSRQRRITLRCCVTALLRLRELFVFV